jgi:predicted Zn-dependent protease with MMP-like domain
MRRRAHTSRGRFRRYVHRAVEALPDRFGSAADNLLVVVENWPAPEDSAARGAEPGGALFGVYRGIPLSERAAGYNAVTPDVIAVFRRPLLRYCRRRKVLREEIYRTVLHEFGHYLGLDEAAVEHV